MKKRQLNEQIKRASLVIKADRMGISSGIEEVISNMPNRLPQHLLWALRLLF